MKRTMILSAITAVGLLNAAGQAQVVISQVYGGGSNSNATYRNDFIELKNIGSTPVDITGWSVQYASNAGPVATNSAPNNAWQVTPLTSMTLAPGQYYLIQEFSAGSVGAALPTADVIDSVTRPGNTPAGPGINMNATGAKVALVNTTTPLPPRAVSADPVPSWSTMPQVMDFVGYGTAADHYEGTGRAVPPSNQNSISRANNGCQDTNDNASDFVASVASAHNSSNIVLCGESFPDLTIALTNSGCDPAVGASYSVTATLGNTQTLTAANAVATVVLPPTFTYASSDTGGVGSASYDAGTRTVTWTVGSVTPGASPVLTVTGTANGIGGLVVTGAVSTTSPNEPTGNNTAVSNNEVVSTNAPLSVIASASLTDTSVATSVDENGFERKLGTIYRVFTSADGSWIIFRADLNGLDSTINTGIVVGHNDGGTWTYSLVAREGLTAPIAALPNSIIDASTFGNIQGINNNGEYTYSCRTRDQMGTASDNTDDVLHWIVAKGTVAGGVSMTIKGGDTNHAGLADADAATAPELAGRNYSVISCSTIQNDGTVSFLATLSGSTTSNAAFLKNNGDTLLAQKGVTVPNGTTFAWKAMDDDSSSDGSGLFVSANGASWLGTGTINTGDTTHDNVVVVNGTIAVQEGSTVGSFTDPAGWATFGSQQVPWCQMLPDASWYIHGYNPATSGFNQGQDWVNRGGVIVASTGSSIFGSNSEKWADNILQRTFFLEAGAGSDYAVGGLTNRSAAINGSDDATDGVVVFRSSEVLVREGAPVQIVEGDVRYLNLINDNRSFIADGSLYITATLRNIDSQCTRNFTGLPQAIVAVPLPTANPCPADLGIQGGFPGSDGQLDNNDFIAFISYFFNQDPHADQGVQGGFPGSDGQFDNNDFIAFINHFFAGCGN